MAAAQKRYKVLVTHPEVPEEALNMLRQTCELIICTSVPAKRQEILDNALGVDGLFWACHEKLNAEVLDTAGRNLKSVTTMSAGLDHVDIPELIRRMIPCGHTPKVLNDAVADIAVGLMIAAARRFHEGRLKIDSSTWEIGHIQWMLGQDITGAVLGFIGFGEIGQTIAKRLQGFDIGKIIYYSRSVSPKGEEFNASHVSFNEVLEQSDFIIVACPLTDQTKFMINEEAFSKMKSTCVFVNIARGEIVDQNALYNALKNNTIFAAGLDVTTPEPIPADHPLLSLPNCVVIPHLGSATKQTRVDMAVVAAQNVLRGLVDKPMIAPAYSASLAVPKKAASTLSLV